MAEKSRVPFEILERSPRPHCICELRHLAEHVRAVQAVCKALVLPRLCKQGRALARGVALVRVDEN